MATPPLHPKDPNSSNCDKISSRCVIWQGKDIPCIDLCTGDTIDDVVNKIAVTLCEIADLVDLDVSCMLGPGETSPTTITELIELMISNICNSGTRVNLLRADVDNLIAIITNPDDPTNPIIPLPPGLYYYDQNGDLIVQLPLTDYAYYLATKIEELIAFNSYYKQQQELINSKFDALEVRVTDLESTAATPPTIMVISQGASHYIPGTVLPIDEAFWNFERTYMNFSGTVGTPAAITTALTKQTPNLANLPQLSTPSLFMKNIAGWNTSPQTLADSFNNLWLTMTDLRARVQADINAIPLIPCILIPIQSQAITAITTTYATLDFVPNLLPDAAQAPTAYKIEVFDHAIDPGLLTPIHTITTISLSVNLVNAAFEVDKEYTIATTAIYACGESVKMTIISKLLTATILFVLARSVLGQSGNTPGQICNGVDAVPITYTQYESTLLIQLKNKITNDPVTVVDTPINIVVRMKHESCDNTVTQTSYQDVTLTIPIGENSVSYIFVSTTMMPCIDGICDYVHTSFSCGISIDNINTEFGSTITVCTTP